METIVFKPEFEEKLKKMRIKTKFVKNLIEDRGMEDAISFAASNYHSWLGFITRAFYWKDTPEGWDFWNKIANS